MLLRFGRWLGIDRTTLAYLFSRGWQLVAGPVAVFLVASYLSPAQQGYYYAFGSILALQLFFEMGLSYVVLQTASHEFVGLHWGEHGQVEGVAHAVERFHVFLARALKWYFSIAVAFVFVVLPAGIAFFATRGLEASDFSWRLPWAAVVITTALGLILSPLLAAIEGSGQILAVARVRVVQGVAGSVVLVLVLLSDGGLYVSSAMVLTSFMVGMVWLYWKKRVLVLRLLSHLRAPKAKLDEDAGFSWRQEVWPMQWRIAVSWMSGYFISQLFVPVLFYYDGPVVAGKMGMTIAIMNVLAVAGITWLNVRMPQLGKLAAVKDWTRFDECFFLAFRRSAYVMALGALSAVAIIIVLQGYAIGARLLSPLEVSLLVLNTLIAHVISALAQYLRAHRQEPFIWLSLIGAMLVGLSTWLLGKYFSSFGMVAGLLAINVVYGLPSAVWLWARVRRKWHG